MPAKLSESIEKASRITQISGINGLYNAALMKFKISVHRALWNKRSLNGLLSAIYYNDISNPKINLAYLELTNNCNLNCKMCTIRQTQKKIGYMSMPLFKSCVDQFCEMGIGTLYLHGVGESLLHPKFKDYLKYAIKKRNEGGIQEVSWVDNGMLFNQNISDLAVELGVDSVSFSIDGVGEVNDNIRLGSKYSVIEQNIKYLIKKRGSASKPKVLLGMVDYGKTEEQKLAVYREWVPYVDKITLIPSLLPDNTWENKNSFDKTQLASPPAFCLVPFQMFSVSWDGNVTGCCLDWSYTLNLGNANNTPLKEIWQGPKYQALRKSVFLKSYQAVICRKCDFWKINFKPAEEVILGGKALLHYGYIYRTVTKRDKVLHA